MKRFLSGWLSIILFLFTLSSNAQNDDAGWIRNHYYKIERTIPMRDGVHLFTSIYIPRDTLQDHPILMERTPYSCSPYGENNWRDFWNSYWKYYFREQYIIVIQDVRGRWMSEGKFEDMRPYIPDKKGNQTDEASDSYDAIDWLLKNIPHNNHRVGVIGISYPGFYATMAAASGHPALKAVSPQAPCTNWFIGDDTHHNGAYFVMDEFDFDIGWGFERALPGPTMIPPEPMDYYTHDNYKFYIENEPLNKLFRLTGDTVAFWKDLYSHPNYDIWWKERDAREATHHLQPAMLWVGGLFDAEDNWGAWNSYLAAETNNPGKDFNKLVIGPWYHGEWASADGTKMGNIQFGSNTSDWYQQNIEIPFFNYYLKNEGDIHSLPEVNIYFTGSNEWRSFSQWPPAGSLQKNLYLTDSGHLSWDKPLIKKGYSEYISDPWKPVPYIDKIHFNRTQDYLADDQRFAERRPDVLSFKTGELSEDLSIAGDVIADLNVSISTTDADFIVKLIDVYPNRLTAEEKELYTGKNRGNPYLMEGYEMPVRIEIMRGRYRKSPEKPEPFVPGKTDEVKFSIGNSAHTFKKGHRIMVQIQSTWFPLVDINPQKFVDIYQCSERDFQKSEIKVFHGQETASHIILPVLNQ